MLEAPEDTWRKNFRLPRDEFQKLLEELRPYISPNPNSSNYRALSAEKKLATTLYYLQDTGSLQMTANSFGLSAVAAGGFKSWWGKTGAILFRRTYQFCFRHAYQL